MNELGCVVSWGQANVDCMRGPSAAIVVLKSFAERMRSNPDNGIHLGIKIMRTTKGLYRNAVLLDLVDRSFEVLIAHEGEEPNQIVGSAQHTRSQNRL